MGSAYGTWAQWRERVNKNDDAGYVAIDNLGISPDHPWMIVHDEHMINRRPGHIVSPDEICRAVAERRAG